MTNNIETAITGECDRCPSDSSCDHCGAPRKAIKCKGSGCKNGNICPDCHPELYWSNGRRIRSGDTCMWG